VPLAANEVPKKCRKISSFTVARQAHNLKVGGSNPLPATSEKPHNRAAFLQLPMLYCHIAQPLCVTARVQVATESQSCQHVNRR
jgi:hypothetical protein